MPGKPRPLTRIGRKRRTLGWTLLTLGLLVGAVWAASGWWGAVSLHGPWSEGCVRGRIMISLDESTNLPFECGIRPLNPEKNRNLLWRAQGGTARQTVLYSYDGWNAWLFCVTTRSPLGGGVQEFYNMEIVFWPIPLLLWTPAALLLRSGIIARRRAITGKCFKCGYDLAGLGVDAPCPECGKKKEI